MLIQKLKPVRFAPPGKNNFFESIIAQVDSYFRENRLSPYANAEMWVKTTVMLLLYFVPYVLIVTGVAAINNWLFYGLWSLMGFGIVGIGTSVMHDAQHGSYSANKKVNSFIGNILEIIGGSTVNWKIQHNILHHTFTNIDGLDEDIEGIKFLRFSPRQPRNWYHRYQHIYVWFFYLIQTLFWMTAKDFVQVIRYNKHNLLTKQKVSLKSALIKITFFKALYFTYVLVLPLLFSGMPWYHVAGGFLLMHFIAGLALSCIFQPAHVVETSGFALPVSTTSGKKQMEDSWAIHEVTNTINFATHNRFLTWFIGGLNFQIEHHLFTGICHVHYPKLAPIVRSACASYNLPYHVQPTFRRAIVEHVKMLRELGKK